MNTAAWNVLLVVAFIIIFDIGFLFGTWWASRNNKGPVACDYEVETPTHHPLFASVCKRCGRVFDCAETKDPALDVCHECWEELKENPDDEYFKQEMFE